jgi:uncharacterized protein YbjQ (UPF0145 family)
MGGSVVRIGQALLAPLPPSRPWGATSYSTQAQALAPYQKAAYQRTTMVLETEVLTGARSDARRQALDRLAEEALQVGADVVVGVELHRGEHDLAKRTIDYLISGTAIVPTGDKRAIEPPTAVLDLNDR